METNTKKSNKEILRDIYSPFFSLKSAKRFDAGEGHLSETATLYMGKKRVAKFAHDGWSGESYTTFVSDDVKNDVHAKIDELDLRRVLLEGDYSFMDTIDEVTYDTVLDAINADMMNLAEQQKEDKKRVAKIKKQVVKGFVFTSGDSTFTMLFKEPMIDVAKKYKNGLEVLQSSYDKTVAEMKASVAKNGVEPVFHNDLEELKALGIKV